METRTRTIAVLTLAALACGGTGAAAASPQREASKAVWAMGRAAEQHPLDEATARKVVTIMRAWKPAPLPKPKGQDAENVLSIMEYGIWNSFTAVVQRELADQNSTATIDGTPALKAAITSQGMSSREFVLALLAYQAARLADDLMSTIPHEPTAVVKRNIEVLRRIGPKKELPSWM